MNAPHELTNSGHQVPRPGFAQFLAALEEWFPRAYLFAYVRQFGALHEDGATPALAAIYARAFLLAPDIVPDPMGLWRELGWAGLPDRSKPIIES